MRKFLTVVLLVADATVAAAQCPPRCGPDSRPYPPSPSRDYYPQFRPPRTYRPPHYEPRPRDDRAPHYNHCWTSHGYAC